MDIPRDKSYLTETDAVQCNGCGGHGCLYCDGRGWVRSGNLHERRCYRDGCSTPIPPAHVAVYCTDQCAEDDA